MAYYFMEKFSFILKGCNPNRFQTLSKMDSFTFRNQDLQKITK